MIESKGWSKIHKPEDVKIWDIFWLQNGKYIQIKEIRQIKRHGVYGTLWEFISREDEIVDFNEFEYIYDEDL